MAPLRCAQKAFRYGAIFSWARFLFAPGGSGGGFGARRRRFFGTFRGRQMRSASSSSFGAGAGSRATLRQSGQDTWSDRRVGAAMGAWCASSPMHSEWNV